MLVDDQELDVSKFVSDVIFLSVKEFEAFVLLDWQLVDLMQSLAVDIKSCARADRSNLSLSRKMRSDGMDDPTLA